jgi:hypothetical protein
MMGQIMFFMRVYPDFGMLVQLLISVIYDVKNFTILIMMWIFTFSIITIVIGQDNSADARYEGVNQYFILFLQTWTDAIGDIHQPTYGFWTK